MTFISQRNASSEDLCFDNDLALDCVLAVKARIAHECVLNNATPRDYACTFLAVVASPMLTLLMQIGDGGIVVDVGNGLEVPIVPTVGEYANMTNFITDDDAAEVLQVRLLPARVNKLAVFSDGLQRMALRMATNTPHEPFFEPFFRILAMATETDEERLSHELLQFLECAAVNDRTDDDKTLALAQWVG